MKWNAIKNTKLPRSNFFSFKILVSKKIFFIEQNESKRCRNLQWTHASCINAPSPGSAKKSISQSLPNLSFFPQSHAHYFCNISPNSNVIWCTSPRRWQFFCSYYIISRSSWRGFFVTGWGPSSRCSYRCFLSLRRDDFWLPR